MNLTSLKLSRSSFWFILKIGVMFVFLQHTQYSSLQIYAFFFIYHLCTHKVLPLFKMKKQEESSILLLVLNGGNCHLAFSK